MANRKSKTKKAVPGIHTKRTALVVLGMHRSGTSALAGVMGHMGCDLPKDLMAPAEMNAKGFFESDGITELNEELLASAGQTWFSFPPFPQEWFRSPKATEFTERAAEQILDSFGRSHLYVVKDPRICRLLPLWLSALDRAGSDPRFVCIHRNPLDVAASLQRWANYEPVYGMMLWLRHVLEAEAASRGIRRVFVSYEQLMSDWAGTVREIGKGLELNWPRPVDSVAPAVQDFLSESLRHFHKSSAEALHIGNAPEWVADAYEIFERWSQAGESQADFERLDIIREGFNASSRTFSIIVKRTQELRAVNFSQRKEIGALSETHKSVVVERDSARTNHATEQKNRAAAEQRAAEIAQTLAQTQAARASLDAEVSRITAVLQAAQAESASHQQNHAAEQALRGQTEQRLRAATEALNATNAQVTALNDQLAQRRAAQTDAEARAEALDSQLAEARASVARLQEETAILGDLREELEVLQQDRDAAQKARAALDAELEATRRSLAEATTQAATLNDQLAQRRAAQTDAKARQEELEALVARGEGNQRALQQEFAEATARLLAQVRAEEQRARDAGAAYVQMEQENTRLEAELESQRDARQQVESALRQRQQEADDQNRLALENAEKFQQAEAALHELEAQYETLKQKAERDAQHLTLLARQAAARMRSDLDTRMAARQLATRTLEQDRVEIEALERKLVERDRIAAEREQLHRRLADSEAHRQALMKSTSWRLTAPLRWIVRTVRRDQG